MTRDEILAMKPGWELDALLAERVMGWHKGEGWGGADWHTKDSEYAESVFKFSPSTDIAAAWMVVEELQGSHLYTDIRTCADFFEVWITNHANNSSTETFASPKLPEAICKAALLAVMDL